MAVSGAGLRCRMPDRGLGVRSRKVKAILVDSDAYLLELSRYVVLNPVRAGMTRDPADWPWSS